MCPIIDLHCDLLGCIQHDETRLHFEHPETNCSIIQMRRGGVKLQTLAIASITRPGSSKAGARQVELYQMLRNRYPNEAGSGREFEIDSPKVFFVFAIENASSLIEEAEPLEEAFRRFEEYQRSERILYVSLTWNHENRFGGGNSSSVGLKRDGEDFLRFLHGKNVAIDFSHTSDALAHDILNFRAKHSLAIPLLASHSNFREVQHAARNLPDEIAQEIIAAKGLIGINFVRRFVGERKEDFLKHVAYGLEIGGEDNLCLGADFYGGVAIPPELIPEIQNPPFQKEFGNSSCYPAFLALLRTAFSQEQVDKIAYQNAARFLM